MDTGELKTPGELDGERLDSSDLAEETPALSAIIPHIQLFDHHQHHYLKQKKFHWPFLCAQREFVLKVEKDAKLMESKETVALQLANDAVEARKKAVEEAKRMKEDPYYNYFSCHCSSVETHSGAGEQPGFRQVLVETILSLSSQVENN